MEDNLITAEKQIQEDNNWLNQKVFNSIEEEVYCRGSFTVYIIHAIAEGKQITGVGFSKARQEISISQFDTEKGKAVSRSRAIHDLFLELKKSQRK